MDEVDNHPKRSDNFSFNFRLWAHSILGPIVIDKTQKGGELIIIRYLYY